MNKTRVIESKTIQGNTTGTHISPQNNRFLVKNEKRLATKSMKNTRKPIPSKKSTKPANNKPLTNKFVQKMNKLSKLANINTFSPLPEITKKDTNNNQTNSQSQSLSQNPTMMSPKGAYIFSGTVIYDSKYSLNPYKWSPDMPENSPDNLKWNNLAIGSQILDKSTSLHWIVAEAHKLSLAPCQTIHVDLKVPKNLADFNPNKCINPFLPDIRLIPIGTQFIFSNSSQCYRLNGHLHLEETSKGNPRPAQTIPIPVNSLYNTCALMPLNTAVIGSSLQRPNRDGYRTLEDWVKGLIQGSPTRPGVLGDLPSLSSLQPNDILYFYDPNTVKNPQKNGVNPDGSIYLENYHESKAFQFKLRIFFDSNGAFTAREIMREERPEFCQVVIPAEEIEQLKNPNPNPNSNSNPNSNPKYSGQKIPKSIYIRSVAIMPKIGQPIVLISGQGETPYYLPDDADRLQVDLEIALENTDIIGHPYNKIKQMFMGKEGKYYVWRWTNLPRDATFGVVMSSDTQPFNKFSGSGRFFIGYSNTTNQTNSYSTLMTNDVYRALVKPTKISSKATTLLDDLIIEDVYIDGIKLDMPEPQYDFKSNETISEWIQGVNKQLQTIPNYDGYTLNLWWTENPEHLWLYLSGVQQTKIPEILLKIRNTLHPLSFVKTNDESV